MSKYEDLSLEEALDFAQEAKRWLNLQLEEHGLENPLLPLVVGKDLA